MSIEASLSFARVGCQKARLVADVIRGKDVNVALRTLAFMPQKSAGLFKRLVESAVSNAEQKKTVDIDNLFIKTVTVDMGVSMRRFRPRAQGRATPIRRKTSHFHVVLAER